MYSPDPTGQRQTRWQGKEKQVKFRSVRNPNSPPTFCLTPSNSGKKKPNPEPDPHQPLVPLPTTSPFFFLLYVINLFGMVTWMWLHECLSVSDDTSSLYLTIIFLNSSPILDSLNTFKTNTDSIQFNSIFLFTLRIINHLIWPHLKSSSHSLLNQSLPFTQSHAWTHLTQVLFQSFRSSLKKMIKALRWEWSEMYVPPRKWWSDDS